MKYLKDDRVTVLCKPVIFKKQGLLMLQALAAYDFADPDALLPEADIWDEFEKALGNQIYDLATYKQQAEFLAAGQCYAPGRTATASCAVSVRVGTLEKRLVVFGDRWWLSNKKASPPKPFVSMPLTWASAFGGKENRGNPYGKGLDSVLCSDGELRVPLPNVELPGQQIFSPDDRPTPASFLNRRSRSLIDPAACGTYDERWLIEHWPTIPPDYDLNHINMASPDQWAKGYFTGGEEVVVSNMHPDEPVLRTSLPRLRARFFLHRTAMDQDHFEEVSANLDTVWLFPERKRGVCVWRAMVASGAFAGKDITAVLAFLEPLGDAPKPIEFYQALTKPTPEDQAPPQEATPAQPALLAPSPSLPPPDPTHSALKAQLQEAEATFQELCRKAGKDPEAIRVAQKMALPAPEITFATAKEQLLTTLAGLAKTNPKLHATWLDAVEKLDAAHAAVQSHQQPAAPTEEAESVPPPEPPKTALTREDIVRMHQAGQSLRGLDLTGIDLSGAVLPGADLTDAILEKANLCAADLTGATLTGAILTQARAEGLIARNVDFSAVQAQGLDAPSAFFTGAKLSGADLTEAKLPRADLAKATLDKTLFYEADLSGAVCDDCRGSDAIFTKAVASGASFRGAALDAADFSEASLDGAVFEKASLRGARFHAAKAPAASFAKADLRAAKCSTGGAFQAAVFTDARLDDALWRESDLSGADFKRAQLDNAFFEECNLEKADLRNVSARKASFNGSNCSNAKLCDANFFKASLRFAQFFDSDLRDSNFFSADFFKAGFNETLMQGANLKRTLLTRLNPIRF